MKNSQLNWALDFLASDAAADLVRFEGPLFNFAIVMISIFTLDCVPYLRLDKYWTNLLSCAALPGSARNTESNKTKTSKV